MHTNFQTSNTKIIDKVIHFLHLYNTYVRFFSAHSQLWNPLGMPESAHGSIAGNSGMKLAFACLNMEIL